MPPYTWPKLEKFQSFLLTTGFQKFWQTNKIATVPLWNKETKRSRQTECPVPNTLTSDSRIYHNMQRFYPHLQSSNEKVCIKKHVCREMQSPNCESIDTGYKLNNKRIRLLSSWTFYGGPQWKPTSVPTTFKKSCKLVIIFLKVNIHPEVSNKVSTFWQH